jgi:hypothetical protein
VADRSRRGTACGVRPKYVPPVDALERLVQRYYEAEIRLRVEDAIARFVDVEAIVAELMERVRDRSYSRSRRRSSANAAPRKPLNPWTTVVSREHSAPARRKSA